MSAKEKPRPRPQKPSPSNKPTTRGGVKKSGKVAITGHGTISARATKVANRTARTSSRSSGGKKD